MGLAARLGNVFAAPSEVFEAIRTAPHSVANWLTPTILFILVGWIGGWLVLAQPSIQQQLNEMRDKMLEQQYKRMPPEQAEKVRQFWENTGPIITKVQFAAAPLMAGLFTPFWWGLIIWLVGAKGFKGGFSYMKAVEVAGLANMIGVLDGVVRSLLIIGLNNLFAAPGLVLLVKDFDPQNPVHGLLGLANVMNIWWLAVAACGVARLSRASFAKAAAWVFGIWIAYMGLFIGIGAALQALGRMRK